MTISTFAEELKNDPVKVVGLLRKILGEFHYQELDKLEASRIWERIKSEGIPKIDGGSSLHVFAEMYCVDGNEYEVLFPVGGPYDLPMSIGIKTDYNWDKRAKTAADEKPNG